MVGAVGLEPTTFGSQNRINKIEKLNEVENLQRFRGSSSLSRLAHLAQLTPLAGVLYPDLTPALSLPASLVARRAHDPKVAGSNPAPATLRTAAGSRGRPSLMLLLRHVARREAAGIEPASVGG